MQNWPSRWNLQLTITVHCPVSSVQLYGVIFVLVMFMTDNLHNAVEHETTFHTNNMYVLHAYFYRTTSTTTTITSSIIA